MDNEIFSAAKKNTALQQPPYKKIHDHASTWLDFLSANKLMLFLVTPL